jgi:putative Ca2+/H+ antiporter (TMEM165/GDT1 family)
MSLDIAIIAGTFILIFPAELPDKTLIATLVLATRYKHLPVWLGVCAAFGVQMLIAVTVGGVLALLPQRPVMAITALLFGVGAVLLIKGGLSSRASEKATEREEEDEVLAKVRQQESHSPKRAFLTDLSQLFTAGLAARTGSPVSVFLGAWGAVIIVAAIAVILGRWLQTRIPLWRIRLVSGVVLAGLCVWTVIEFVNA